MKQLQGIATLHDLPGKSPESGCSEVTCSSPPLNEKSGKKTKKGLDFIIPGPSRKFVWGCVKEEEALH